MFIGAGIPSFRVPCQYTTLLVGLSTPKTQYIVVFLNFFRKIFPYIVLAEQSKTAFFDNKKPRKPTKIKGFRGILG